MREVRAVGDDRKNAVREPAAAVERREHPGHASRQLRLLPRGARGLPADLAVRSIAREGAPVGVRRGVERGALEHDFEHG